MAAREVLAGKSIPMNGRGGRRHDMTQTSGDDIDGVPAGNGIIKNGGQGKNITERPKRLFVGKMEFRRRIPRRNSQIGLPHPRGQVTFCGSETDQERSRAQENRIGGYVGVKQTFRMQEIERRDQRLQGLINFLLGQGLLGGFDEARY